VTTEAGELQVPASGGFAASAEAPRRAGSSGICSRQDGRFRGSAWRGRILVPAGSGSGGRYRLPAGSGLAGLGDSWLSLRACLRYVQAGAQKSIWSARCGRFRGSARAAVTPRRGLLQAGPPGPAASAEAQRRPWRNGGRGAPAVSGSAGVAPGVAASAEAHGGARRGRGLRDLRPALRLLLLRRSRAAALATLPAGRWRVCGPQSR
jgi:hypothetical protein